MTPVGWSLNPELGTIDVGGHDVAETKWFRRSNRKPQDIAEWEATDPAFKAERERMRPYADLAKLVVRLRALERLSQEELAQRMGTTKAAISRLESGRHRPTVEALRRLAEALGGRLTLTIVMPPSAESGSTTERR